MDIASLVEVKTNPGIPKISPGDTVRVSAKVVEGERERTQVFRGVVIATRGGGASANFTVRHVAYGVGVERTFFFNSPLVEKVEVLRHAKVRRAKLFYLRGRSTKTSRLKERRSGKEEVEQPEIGQQEIVQPAAVQPEVSQQASGQPEAGQQEVGQQGQG